MLDILDGEMLEQFGNRPIAFSKIDGFDVTPLTPSVSISFFRSPLATKLRARKSSQTAWPWFSSALTGFMMPCSVRAGPFSASGNLQAGRRILSTSPWGDADGQNMRIPAGQRHSQHIDPRGRYRSRASGCLAAMSARFCDGRHGGGLKGRPSL